jgi:hypothetical protein
MIEKLTQNYAAIAQWLNESQRGVGVAIFLLTLALGWSSGIFSTLRRKPKFKLQLINGPTFVCTFSTGKIYDELDVHRTGVRKRGVRGVEHRTDIRDELQAERDALQ